MQQEFEHKMIDMLGLKDESKERQMEVIGALGGIILQSLLIKVTEKLSDENVILFEKCISEGSTEKVNVFLTEKVPELDTLLQEACQEVVEEYQKA